MRALVMTFSCYNALEIVCAIIAVMLRKLEKLPLDL